ncbi:MAG: hypothetical protein HYY06_04995, partial [Deltaproteobacteria bacterium]|nr:hypothetical protein [Deltaproteobacteria bacterium]
PLGLHGCLENECVECNEDADCTDGETQHGCDPRTNTCSPNDAGEVSQCQACVSDLDCSDDGTSACVVVSFGDPAVEVGTYCAYPCADLQGFPSADELCAARVGRGNRCLSVQRRGDELTEYDFCAPATTTCEGYRAHDDPGCEGLQGTCSHDGDGGDGDGACLDGRCSYPCAADGDCPGGYGCGGDLAGYCDVT